MVAIPPPINTVAHAIYGWHEAQNDDGHRRHLGASMIGHECRRYLWLSFRWVGRERFSGRMLRLFDTGKREEIRLIEELRAIGCVVEAEENGHQIRVSFAGGHGGGSLDGIIHEGVPEAPRKAHVLEAKTMNAKAFADLQKQGVEKSKPLHYAQMQTYMRLMKVNRALYVAVNKQTDEIYTERVRLDEAKADAIIARATAVIEASEPPPRLSDRPDWFACKLCAFHDHCHGTARPEVNCRTCAHSTPEPDGTWSCARHGGGIPTSFQRGGCTDHRYIPALLHWAEVIGASDAENWVEYTHGDVRFINGERGPASFPSHELAALDPALLGDANIQVLRMQFDGTATA